MSPCGTDDDKQGKIELLSLDAGRLSFAIQMASSLIYSACSMLSFPKYASTLDCPSNLPSTFICWLKGLSICSEFTGVFFLLLLYLKSWKVFLGIVALAHINIHFPQVVKRARIFTDFLLILFWISTDINIHFAQVVKRGRIAASSGNNCGERNHCLRNNTYIEWMIMTGYQVRKAQRCESNLQSETINDWPTQCYLSWFLGFARLFKIYCWYRWEPI